jgi:hypothetical protein
VQALLGRPCLDELAQRARQEIPTRAEVMDQALRLVLGQDRDPPHPGVDTIGEGEVDIAEMSRERHGRLALPACQLSEAGAVTSGKNECDRVLRQPHIRSNSVF